MAGLLRTNRTPANKSAGVAEFLTTAGCTRWIAPLNAAPNSQNTTIMP